LIPRSWVRAPPLKRAAPERAAQFKRATLRSGDILISKDGTIGRVAVVPQELEGSNITQHLVRFSPHPSLNRDYLVLALQCPAVQRWLTSETKGVALQGVNVEDFRRLPIPIPPVAEQEEVVRCAQHLLSLAGGVEHRVTGATARTDNLTSAILSKAFRGELVATEAELASQERRGYESAAALLARLREVRERGTTAPRTNGRRAKRAG
jgi:Type I restriction modification DNA specificity domain